MFVSSKVSEMLGEHDVYLDVFIDDMKYSDRPVSSFISEDVADEYLLKDNSCEGMEHCYSIDAAVLDSLLMALDIKMCLRSYPVYVPMMRPFYLTSLSDKYMKITDPDLMEAVKIANSIYSGEHFLELSSDIICEHISYDEGYDEDNEWSKD